jgi:hypothetical protein
MTYKLLINCTEAAANATRVAVASMITGDVATNWPGKSPYLDLFF